MVVEGDAVSLHLCMRSCVSQYVVVLRRRINLLAVGLVSTRPVVQDAVDVDGW